MNETRFKKIYADNKLKRFRARKNENISTKSMNNQKMINEIAEDFEKTKKMTNVINEKIIETENNENVKIENVVIVINVEHRVAFLKILTLLSMLKMKYFEMLLKT